MQIRKFINTARFWCGNAENFLFLSFGTLI